ncbi:MAG: DUF6273 domain-containing protein [Roseburia sp.]|nr:DUF6273 domain-containing protein [Roseburia sp.]
MIRAKIRKPGALILVAAMLAGLLPGGGVEVCAAEGGGSYGLSNPVRNEQGIVTWDCVEFGSYWQDEYVPITAPENPEDRKVYLDSNGTEMIYRKSKYYKKMPIKWRVLSVDGNDAFLMADKCLDLQRYNDKFADVTWEKCTTRSWLNGYDENENVCGTDYRSNNFRDKAFSQTEQSAIRDTIVVNENNPDFNIAGGNDTTDKIYLLSISEALSREYGFSLATNATDVRKMLITDYVAVGGEMEQSPISNAESTTYWTWWLRSPGQTKGHACFVNALGYLAKDGIFVGNNGGNGVCPVLHLDLSSRSVWSPAGTVSSDGTSSEKLLASESEKYGLKNPQISGGMTTWDCVWLGNYWQDEYEPISVPENSVDGEVYLDSDGTEMIYRNEKYYKKMPIKWRVLSVDGDDAFLLADQNLDCQKYNDTNTNVTWETCTMRSWLNGYDADDFLNKAFNQTEQEAIRDMTVVNEDNPNGTEGGNNTVDKVYLLSLNEATNTSYGFTKTVDAIDTREAVNTAYTKAQGAGTNTTNGNGVWWLRSPGSLSGSYASYVNFSGYVYKSGSSVSNYSVTVRPALHLDLSSQVWSPAGTVGSNGTINEQPPAPKPTPTPTPEPDATATPSVATKTPASGSEPTQPTPPELSPTEPASSNLPSVATPTLPIATASSTSQTPPVVTQNAVIPSISQNPVLPDNPSPDISGQTPKPAPTLPPDLTKEEQTAADEFVDQHVKDPSGNIITEVTDLTRDILVSGEKEWKKLSENSQTAVDVRLWEAGSQYTYEQLLKLAKAYKIPGFKVIKFMKKNSKAKLKLMKCKGAQIVCVSSNKKVATVNKKGVIRAKKPGRARITFAAVKGIYTNRLVVDVRVKKKFKNADELTNFKSKVIRTPTVLIAKKRLLNQSSRIDVYDLRKTSKVTYEPIDKQILAVNKKGKYTGKKKGSTLVRVTIHQNEKDYLLYLYVTIH